MSAICGIYYQKDKKVSVNTGSSMLNAFKRYHADDRGSWYQGGVFLACHAQHVTPESENEKLPYYDEQADLVITADAIIDNRQELFNRLAIPYELRGGMSDSQLILEAYKKWDTDCPKFLIGDFAFAIWNGRLRELFCAVDATGRRTFYYFYESGLFAFSTLIKPLFVIPEIKCCLNDVWIADFLAIPWVIHQLDPELTLYKDVYLLPAGHTLTVNSKGVSKSVYWQVTPQSELRLLSDKEYVEAFLDVFKEAVRCRLRSRRPVGVMMSGGLDSTSVACVAASELAQKGQRLSAFSMVPMEGYNNFLPESQIADETPYIEAVKQMMGNIDIIYCRSEGKHSLSDTNRLFDMLEQPYKIFENIFWLEGIQAIAQNKDIGVLLDGQAGNATISWGSMHYQLESLARKGKWLILLREAKAYALRQKRSHCRVFARALLNCFPSILQEAFFQIRNRSENNHLMELTPVNPAFARRSYVTERLHQFGFDRIVNGGCDSFTNRKILLGAECSSHTAPILTKQSLAYRIVKRDPTMDKRVIEFCLRLPEDQYARNGQERRLIRNAMEGILPNKVRLNEDVRGKQSADWLQRLLPYWRDIISEMENIGELELERRYLDIEKIMKEMGKTKSPTNDMADDSIVRMLIRALIFSRFLRHETSIKKDGIYSE